jgi:hypothetical protein
VARTFSEDIYDLPAVDLLDWELWEQLDKLIAPYVPPGHDLPLYSATDNRGEYSANDLAAFRREVEEQERPPEIMRLTLSTSYPRDYFVALYLRAGRAPLGGRVQSEDESFVHHMTARIRELFTLAAERARPTEPETFNADSIRAAEEYPLEEFEAPRYVNVATNVQPMPTPRERRRAKLHAFFYNPWVVSVGSGLVLVGIGAAIFALTH